MLNPPSMLCLRAGSSSSLCQECSLPGCLCGSHLPSPCRSPTPISQQRSLFQPCRVNGTLMAHSTPYSMPHPPAFVSIAPIPSQHCIFICVFAYSHLPSNYKGTDIALVVPCCIPSMKTRNRCSRLLDEWTNMLLGRVEVGFEPLQSDARACLCKLFHCIS